jgi:hypothetical protein
VELIEQLMAVQDFLSFECLALAYREVVAARQDGDHKLPEVVVARIEMNCLPAHLGTKLDDQPASLRDVLFLSNRPENSLAYQPSSEGSEAMKYLLEQILAERGCLLRPRMCPCFDARAHGMIEKQYDQEFNPHKFISAASLICRDACRVLALEPQKEQLDALKDYLIVNIKWLLNLNESCLPEHRKCINLKIFDLILCCPYTLAHNEFLQQVTEDLLLDRLPHTFHYLHKLIAFLLEEGAKSKLERISEKLLTKGINEAFSLEDKIRMWDLLFGIYGKDEEKLKELL